MKKCEKCNKMFTDDHAFCPDCGSPLTTIPAVAPPPTGYNNMQVPNSQMPVQSTDWFKSWGWLLFLILGLICQWWFSALLGFAIACVGFGGAISSGNGMKIGASVVLGIIAIIFLIIAVI